MSSNRKKLLVTGMPFLPELVTRHIKSAEIVCTTEVSEESLSEKVRGFDGLSFMQFATHFKITRKIIESGDKLKFIQTGGVGYEQIDLEAATDRGVVVMNVPAATTESVAEHTVALILACAKNIVRMHKAILAGEWRTMDLGVELWRKKLGIIGFGRIGKAVAERMKAFGMEILVYGPHIKETDASRMGCRRVDLVTLLKDSDVITIHVPLNKETKGLIGESQFKMMKRSVIIVNTARGAIIDEKALIEALTARRIRCAGLDVFETEPIEKDNRLRALDNVVMTPHSAALNQDAMSRLMEHNGIQLEKALGGIYENVVNPDVLTKIKK